MRWWFVTGLGLLPWITFSCGGRSSNNRTGIYVDGRVPSTTQVYRNNLIIGGEVGLKVMFGSAPTWVNNLIFGSTVLVDGTADPTGQNGNLSAAPQLANADGGDYRLTAASPAIDAGTHAFGALPQYDQQGGARVVDGNGDHVATVDIGAYEYAAPIVCTP
ncbi:MAG TPA: choice-of-anchor Q domain-containing protein [Polyangiaceae bacterium]|nr:choice-of-anchor Q domain-containing protein [Polyangiaceae bacterium]